ncbi:hypothetical protein [Deinococcus kurensis]|uniref:hypothetical protein n=1 Tax=Deinococcus kurensis TaxID=2662757 RepID=UPI0012D34760|nr:hypothetical protein [Deinococcus kurensis]
MSGTPRADRPAPYPRWQDEEWFDLYASWTSPYTQGFGPVDPAAYTPPLRFTTLAGALAAAPCWIATESFWFTRSGLTDTDQTDEFLRVRLPPVTPELRRELLRRWQEAAPTQSSAWSGSGGEVVSVGHEFTDGYVWYLALQLTFSRQPPLMSLPLSHPENVLNSLVGLPCMVQDNMKVFHGVLRWDGSELSVGDRRAILPGDAEVTGRAYHSARCRYRAGPLGRTHTLSIHAAPDGPGPS